MRVSGAEPAGRRRGGTDLAGEGGKRGIESDHHLGLVQASRSETRLPLTWQYTARWSGSKRSCRGALSSVGPELHVGFGPEYLVSPDGIELSGHFQVALEGGIGISDAKSHIGLTWRHTSNSGIELPNLGRDFVMIQVRFYK